MEPIMPLTIIHYKDGNNDRKMIVNDFNCKSSFHDIYQWISKEFDIISSYLEIDDPGEGRVDFNDAYMKNFRPYGAHQQFEHPGAQSTTSKPLTVKLYIVPKSGGQQSSGAIACQQTLNVKPSSNKQRCPALNLVAQQPEDEREETLSSNSSGPICALGRIMLNDKDPRIKFTIDLNETIRDDYEPIMRDVTTGEQKTLLVNIQGDKTKLKGTKTRISVLPKVKISEGTIPSGSESKFNLVACILNEICIDGVRTLYHHPEHELVNAGNEKTNNQAVTAKEIGSSSTEKKNQLNKRHVIIPFDKKMLDQEGHEIKLKTRVILQAKTHPNKQKDLFCQLENQYLKGTNSETTRVAILLEEHGKLIWDTLVLSKATVFCHSKSGITYIDIDDSNGECIEKIPKREGAKTPTKSKPSETVSEDAPPTKKLKTSRKQVASSQVNQNMMSTALTMDRDARSLHYQPSTSTKTYIQQQKNGMTSSDVPTLLPNFNSQETMVCGLQNDFNSSSLQMTATTNILNISEFRQQENSSATILPPEDVNPILYQQELPLLSPDKTDTVQQDLVDSFESPTNEIDIFLQDLMKSSQSLNNASKRNFDLDSIVWAYLHSSKTDQHLD